jgi:REP element-mobilizing transposase RayT
MGMDKPYTLSYTRRNLPHWLVADHSYFITLRLKGTLPKQVIADFRAQRTDADEAEVLELARKQFASIERILDSISNIQWLEDQRVASMVWNSLDWLRGRGWLIYAGVLMSNHIHLLMRNEEGRTQEMLDDLARFKNYTAREANKVLGRRGSVWAREDFDPWIRTHEKFKGTVRYIANNPVKAGLVRHWSEWKWFSVDESVRCYLEEEQAST